MGPSSVLWIEYHFTPGCWLVMIRQRLSLPLPPLFLSFACWVRGSSVALNICISSTEPCWPLEGLQSIPVSSWWEKSFYQLLGKIQKPWSRKITPSNQSTSIICQLRWKSQTVCWICITSPQRGRWTKRTGGLLSIRPPPHQHVKCLRSMAEGIYSHNKDRCHLLSA